MNRKTLIGTFALVASLSAPLAFAQSQTDASSTDASAQSTTASDASAQSTTPTDASTQSQSATTSNDASAATTQGDPSKKSWADVDADKDGNLSKAEAAAVPALGQVFDQADANADGSLSADEYKAYVKTQEKK
jgi:hypothetical protein